MSAIVAVLGENFAVFCGETMFCLDTGERSRIEKVKMVQDSFLYGFTGKNDSAVEFFEGLIDYKLNPTENMNKLSYIQLIDILNERFDSYKSKGVKEDFDTYAIICGPVEGRMQCTSYSIRLGKYEKEIIEGNWELQFAGSFLNEHYKNFIMDKKIGKKDIIIAIVNAFQYMVDKGVEFDKSINNDVVAYLIINGNDKPYITKRLK